MKRRHFFALGSAFLVSATGCLTTNQATYGLDRIEISNKHTSEITITTTIQKNGNVKYESDTTLLPGNDSEIRDTWMQEPADYIVTVSLPNNLEKTLSTESLNQKYDDLGTGRCYEFDFVIDSKNEIRPHVGSEPCNTG